MEFISLVLDAMDCPSTLYTVNARWKLVTVFDSVVLAIGLYKNAPDRGRKELVNWIGKQSRAEAPVCKY